MAGAEESGRAAFRVAAVPVAAARRERSLTEPASVMRHGAQSARAFFEDRAGKAALTPVRYAIYLTTPRDAALTEAARRWLGRCAFTGETTPAEAPAEAGAAVPARYGWHATMRAPFRLRDGADEAALVAAFRDFRAGHGPVEARLRVARLSRFVALVAEDQSEIEALQVSALHAFEPFRAPLSPADRARRNPDRLDDRGRELLDMWGYPQVMERFRFHMTLSGPVEGDELARVEAAARDYFAPFTAEPQQLVFGLYAEPEAGGPFTIVDVDGDRVTEAGRLAS